MLLVFLRLLPSPALRSLLWNTRPPPLSKVGRGGEGRLPIKSLGQPELNWADRAQRNLETHFISLDFRLPD